MKAEIVKLGRNGLYYGVAMIASKAAGFLMLPIYTRYLTPTDYGVAELLMTTVDIVGMLAGLGITAAIFKVHADYKTDDDKNRVFATALTLVLALGAITAAIGITFSGVLSNLVFFPHDHAALFRLMFITYFLQQGVISIPLLFIRTQENARLFMAISLTKLSIQVALNVTLVAVLQIGLLGILLSALIGEALVATYLLFFVSKKVGFALDRKIAAALFRFGYPFMFVFAGNFILVFADRYFLNVYADLAAIGIYALAYKLAFVMTFLVVVPFQQVWEPQRFRIADTPRAAETFQRVFMYFNIALLVVGLAIALFVHEILVVMSDPEFWSAESLVPYILIAYVFYAWSQFCDFGLHKTGRSARIAQASSLAAVFILIALYFLVPRFGIVGAPIALIFAFGIRFAAIHRLANAAYPMQYGFRSVALLLAVAIGVYGLSLTVKFDTLATSLAFKTAMLGVFVALIYMFFLKKNERRLLGSFIARPLAARFGR